MIHLNECTGGQNRTSVSPIPFFLEQLGSRLHLFDDVRITPSWLLPPVGGWHHCCKGICVGGNYPEQYPKNFQEKYLLPDWNEKRHPVENAWIYFPRSNRETVQVQFWFYISPSLYRTRDLHQYISVLSMFFKQKPVDWIIDDFFRSMYCSPEWNSKKCKEVVFLYW